MTDEAHAIAAVFGRAAAAYDSVIPFFARFGERLVERAGIQPGDRVLDVGCGRGAALFPAAERTGRPAMSWAWTCRRTWWRCSPPM